MVGQVMRFKNTQGMTEREAELEATVEELVWAMHLWANDEDGIHYNAYRAFLAAVASARIPFAELDDDEYGNPRYTFTPEWMQRQRVVWAMRNQDETPPPE